MVYNVAMPPEIVAMMAEVHANALQFVKFIYDDTPAYRPRRYEDEVVRFGLDHDRFAETIAKLEKESRPASRPWIRPAYQRAAARIGPKHLKW